MKKSEFKKFIKEEIIGILSEEERDPKGGSTKE
jgi:hypothetical protein